MLSRHLHGAGTMVCVCGYVRPGIGLQTPGGPGKGPVTRVRHVSDVIVLDRGSPSRLNLQIVVAS